MEPKDYMLVGIDIILIIIAFIKNNFFTKKDKRSNHENRHKTPSLYGGCN